MNFNFTGIDEVRNFNIKYANANIENNIEFERDFAKILPIMDKGMKAAAEQKERLMQTTEPLKISLSDPKGYVEIDANQYQSPEFEKFIKIAKQAFSKMIISEKEACAFNSVLSGMKENVIKSGLFKENITQEFNQIETEINSHVKINEDGFKIGEKKLSDEIRSAQRELSEYQNKQEIRDTNIKGSKIIGAVTTSAVLTGGAIALALASPVALPLIIAGIFVGVMTILLTAIFNPNIYQEKITSLNSRIGNLSQIKQNSEDPEFQAFIEKEKITNLDPKDIEKMVNFRPTEQDKFKNLSEVLQ